MRPFEQDINALNEALQEMGALVAQSVHRSVLSLVDASVAEYQRRGFVPEALVNFLCLLGWSPKDDREKLPIAEIVRLFDLPGVNQSNARFDEKKLSHMNMVYLHEMEPGTCFAFARDFLASRNFFAGRAPEDSYLREVVLLCQPKIRSFEDLP